MVLANDGGNPGRIESLMASLNELTDALSRRSAELEKEVAVALYADGGDRIAQLELENAQLRVTLDERAVIEQAKGMLMATRRCGPTTAVEILAERAARSGRSMREVAGDLVSTLPRPVHARVAAAPERRAGLGRPSSARPTGLRAQMPAPRPAPAPEPAPGRTIDLTTDPLTTDPLTTGPLGADEVPENPHAQVDPPTERVSLARRIFRARRVTAQRQDADL